MRLTVKSAELLKKYKPEARKLLRQYRAVNPKQLDSTDGTGQPPTFHVGEPMQTVRVPLQIREEGKEERTANVLVKISFEEEAQESSTPGNFMCFQVSIPPASHLHFPSLGRDVSLCSALDTLFVFRCCAD